jgi:feruloyl esterase
MGRNQDVVRLFMMPGMAHCRGGDGPDQVHFMAALERWREQGVEPKVLIATKTAASRVDMTRPICAVPQVARYKGTGSTNDADNFVCK